MTAITTSATHGPWYLTDNGRDPVFITDEHGEQVSLAEMNARFIMLKRANAQLFAHGEKMYAQLTKSTIPALDRELATAYDQGYADGRRWERAVQDHVDIDLNSEDMTMNTNAKTAARTPAQYANELLGDHFLGRMVSVPESKVLRDAEQHERDLALIAQLTAALRAEVIHRTGKVSEATIAALAAAEQHNKE